MCYSLLYAVAHACVTVVLSYSTAELGDTLGAYGGGTLYVVYSLSSLFLAKPVCAYLGPKNALVASLTMLSAYVGAFLCSMYFEVAAWPLFICGSFIGGLAAGVLWTAQGEYFTISAEIFSFEKDECVSKANDSFAALFAGIYLSCETLFKLFATVLLYGLGASRIPLFFIYFVGK
jgi:hypothetical protein